MMTVAKGCGQAEREASDHIVMYVSLTYSHTYIHTCIHGDGPRPSLVALHGEQDRVFPVGRPSAKFLVSTTLLWSFDQEGTDFVMTGSFLE